MTAATASGEPATPGFEQDSGDDELFALAAGYLGRTCQVTRAAMVYEYLNEDGERCLGWYRSDSMAGWEAIAAMRLIASRIEKAINWPDD